MRLALLSDIHGNLHALDAVLSILAREQIDQNICLGDVVEHGPHPKETLARVLELDCPIVMGNTDERMVTDYTTIRPDGDVWPGYEQDVWSARQLSPAEKAAIRSFQPTVSLTLASDVQFLGFHGSPRSHSDYIAANTPDDDKLMALLGGYPATVMAGGHSHQQMVRRICDIILINPGSVGATYEETANGFRRPWWAEYAVVEVTDKAHVSVDLRRATYDVEAHLKAYADSGMPHAERWIAEWNQNSD